MNDLYATCSCGSGKKFKWCCQPIAAGIEKAFTLEEAGQHENALRAIEEVVRAHENNPEAWGQKAKLLYMQGNVDAAEEALEKAFQINSKYAYGLYLRASMRFNEGEIPGALILARRAADAFDSEAREILSALYSMIFDAEMRHNRPVAARVALEQIIQFAPGEEGPREGLEQVFGENARLPETARKRHALRSPGAAHRASWDAALKECPPKLSALASAYESLTQQDPNDDAAWYNLGLTKAWLGDNKAAVAALDSFLDKTKDESAAIEAATLQEVLRCGAGMEEQSDYVNHVLMVQLRDPQPVNALLQEWLQSRRLIPLQTEQEGVLSAILLELTTTGLVTVGNPGTEGGRLAGYLVIAGSTLRIQSPVKEPFERLKDELRTKLSLGLTEIRTTTTPPPFHDTIAEALLFPLGPGEDEQAEKRSIDYAQRFFEDIWIHRPSKSLSNIPPIDAAGSPVLARKLRGIVAFLRQCARFGMLNAYDFNRILHKVGLGETPAVTDPGTVGTVNIPTMNAAELAQLSVDTLSEDQLEQAFQTALRLDAQEIATHFASAAVARPAQAGKPDRYAYYAALATRAAIEGNHDAALGYLQAGLHHDAEVNAGKRHDDYELRRANVLTQRGDVDAAEQAFTALIARSPRVFKYRGQAAEAMLKLKQPAKALQFAEEGLKEAGLANDRDASGYMNDLIGAAKRQGA
jgi:tetratricopeptide (TPR) repeat protein